MPEQRYYVDLRQGGDTGENTSDAIQPILDGQPGNSTTFQRPSENLRGRTEASRQAHRDHYYARDFAANMVIEGTSDHSIAWAGSTSFGGTGIVTQTGALTIRPLLTPRVSTKGTFTIGTVGVNEVTYTVTATGFAARGQDEITVEHRDIPGAAMGCNISPGPIKRVLLTFNSANPAHTCVLAMVVINNAITADPDLGVGVGAPYFTASTTSTGVCSASAETRVEGTADQEAHVLTSGLITAFTTANPLQNGDAVAVWYRKLTDEPPPVLTPGGRWDSNPDRGTSTVPAPSLFITSAHPEKIPGAVPLFKIVNDVLVWFSGDRFPKGSSGPIGSVTGALVSLDSSPWAGAPTNTINGGIDNPLPTPGAQAAFNSVNTRLGQLRTAWTCTDGANSTGGHFNGASAVQNAITALAGTPGTLVLRRGIYTLPNTYAIPAGVTIVTDGSVILRQNAPTVLSIGAGCSLSYLSIAVAGIQITTGDNVRMDHVTITGRLQIGNDFTGSFVTVDGSGTAAAYSVSFTGNNASVDKLSTVHSVNVGGVNNRITILNITKTTSALPSSIVRLNGVNCAVDTLTIEATTDITGGTALLEIGGSENTVTNFLTNTVGGPITAGKYGVWLNGCLVARMHSINVLMDFGSPLVISGAVSIDAAQCSFNNTTGADPVVLSSGMAGAQRIVFQRSTFSQGLNTASTMMTFLADSFVSKVHFDTCRFVCSKLSGAALIAQGARFSDCTFLISNPVVAGAPRLGGDVNGQTVPVFRFIDNCVLDDCTVDGNDAEVNNNAGRPDFSNALFVELYKAEANRLRLINLNQHMYSSSDFGTLINLRQDARLRGWTTDFTSTASVQGGAEGLAAVVALNKGDSYACDYTLRVADPYPGGDTFMYPFAAGNEGGLNITNFHAERIHILRGFTGICRTSAGGGRNLIDCSFTDCRFGDGTGCVDVNGIPIPEGGRNTFTRCTFYHAGGTAGVFHTVPGVTGYLNFHNCVMGSIAPEDQVFGIFHGTGGAHVLTYCNFTGNTIRIVALVAATTKPFVSGTVTFDAAKNAGAGNTQQYVTGTATAPSFGAVVNVWV